MTKANPEMKSGDYQQTLRDRLNKLTERHQQAEIAARTGTPPANVHRYLKAGKIPSEFLTGIVEHFDVDPEWLLTGKGEQASSTVKAETAAKAGELLDLVQTMNAISRMRMGAIVKDKDRKLMRELGDALKTYDRIRETMNEQSRPVMRQLVDEIRENLLQMNIPRGQIIAQTALELSRICLDDDILLDLDSQLAGVAYLTGQLEEAVFYDRRVFARRLTQGVIGTPEAIASCTNLVMLLRDSGRWAESRRIGMAVLALIPDLKQDVPALKVLQMMMGMMEVEAGDVPQGLARVHSIWPKLPIGRRVSETVMYLRIVTLTGMLDYFAAAETGDASMGKSRLLVRWAALAEDNKALKHALSKLVGDGPEFIPEREYDARRARLLAKILSSRKPKLSEYDTLAGESPPVVPSKQAGDLVIAVHRGQIARLLNDKKNLRAMVSETERCFSNTPKDRGTRIEFAVIHLRNMKALSGKAFKEQIAELQLTLDDQVENGFHGLKDLV